MTTPGSNNPPVTIELSAELADFVVENCEANMEFGLKSLQMLTSRDLQERLVANMERFKALREAVLKAREG